MCEEEETNLNYSLIIIKNANNKYLFSILFFFIYNNHLGKQKVQPKQVEYYFQPAGAPAMTSFAAQLKSDHSELRNSLRKVNMGG